MKKLNFLVAFIIVLLFSIYDSTAVYGISSTLSSSPSSVLQGNTFTVRVSLSGDVCAANFNISYDTSKLTLISGDTSYAWAEGESLPSYTFKAKTGVAGSANISLSGTASDTNYKSSGLSGSTAVTITAPVVTSPTPTTPAKTTATATTGSNANLKRLVPNYEGLSPNFNSSVTKYSLTVPATATSLGLSIGVEATGAKYWITGEDNLQMGDNTVSVTVTATDGTKKVYTIIVTKAADVAKANAYLSSIVIDGKTLAPEFTAENLAYDIGTVTSDIEKLTVLAFAQTENSKIEITGNEGLVEGENIIKVKVTAIDGITTKEYTIKVTKDIAAVVAGATVDEANKLIEITPSKLDNFLSGVGMYIRAFWLVLALFAFCLFEFAQIVYLYRKLYKLNKSDTLYFVEKDNETNVEDETAPSRRRSNESEIVIDDTSDELVDNSKDVE